MEDVKILVHLTFSFPDSLAVKTSEGVFAPTYETLNRDINVDASIYQSLNSDPESPDVRVEKTIEGLAAPVYQQLTNGDAASIYQTVNSDPAPSEA